MSDPISLTPPVTGRDHIQGFNDAPITLLEFGDYQCPYCGAAYPVVHQIQRNFGRKLRFIFRNFPLTQAHPYALIAAEAAEAAALQGKFWEMHDLLYENQDNLQPDLLLALAQKLGLDIPKFGAAIQSDDLKRRIKEDRQSGIHSGVNGTPCFFINGVRYNDVPDLPSLRLALET
jgi:protein-disulfide isomerase